MVHPVGAPATSPALYRHQTAIFHPLLPNASLLPRLLCLSFLFRAEPTEAVILSIYEGLQPHQVVAIRNNRAAYAEKHGYRQVLHRLIWKILLVGRYHTTQMHCRYCEFNSRPDPTRGASWNKIASILLVVHCSQYVMALDSGRQQGRLAAQAGLVSTQSMHIGKLLTPAVNCCCVLLADAVIVNYDTSIGQLFQEYGPSKDILFSRDYGGNSIINAGNPCCEVVPEL